MITLSAVTAGREAGLPGRQLMGSEPPLIDLTFALGVARVVEDMNDVQLLVPRFEELVARELKPQPVKLGDLARLVRVVEILDRLAWPDEVGPRITEDVI